MYDNNNYPNDYSNHTGSEQNGLQTGNASEQRGIGYRSYQNTGNQAGSGAYGQNAGQSSYGANVGQSAYGGGSAYQGSAGNYHYGNTYPNGYAQMEQKKEKKHREKKPGSGYFKKALVAVTLGLFFGLFAGIGLYAVDAVTGMSDKDKEVLEETETSPVAEADTEIQAPTDVPTIKQSDSATMVVTDVTEVVKNVMPSIVAVNNHYTETMSWFGQSMNSEADASGSGIIVGLNDSELLIVTNYHVVADTDKLTVQFNEGSEAEALIKGQDSKMDLAVIAVPVTELSDRKSVV